MMLQVSIFYAIVEFSLLKGWKIQHFQGLKKRKLEVSFKYDVSAMGEEGSGDSELWNYNEQKKADFLANFHIS